MATIAVFVVIFIFVFLGIGIAQKDKTYVVVGAAILLLFVAGMAFLNVGGLAKAGNNLIQTSYE